MRYTLLHLSIFLWVASTASAQFLDFSQPARATAMGGNLVALPEGPSAMTFNPAGLGSQDRYQASARYEDLFSGLENDDISTGNLTLLYPAGGLGAFGASWDHLGANQLEQDNVRVGWGKDIPTKDIFQALQVGFSLSYLSQRYVLSVPLQGVSLTNVSASSLALGAGVLLSPFQDFTLGLAADDLNSPNLGVVGTDRVPMLVRWGASAKLFDHQPVQLNVTAAQSLANSQLDTQGGLEVFFAEHGIRIRGGLDDYQGAVGFGYNWSDFMIDYAYSFSVFGTNQFAGAGLPGSNLLELGVKWGGNTSETEYDEFMKKAQTAEQVQRWGWAAWYYQEALVAKPKDKIAIEGRLRNLPQYNLQRAAKFYADGQLAEKKSALEDARFYYEMAYKLAPSQTEYVAALARVNASATAQVAQASAEKFYQDGLLAAQKGMLFDAKYDFDMAAKLAPEMADYAKALAGVNIAFAARAAQTSNDEQNINEYVRQVSDDLSKKNPKAASSRLAEALRKYPGRPALELIQKLIDSWEKNGSFAGGSASSQAVQLLQNEADLYISKGRPDLAKRNLEEALKTQPANSEVKKKLAELENSTTTVSPEKMKLAEELYEKGLECYLAGDLDGGIRAWEAALKANPNHVKAQNNLIRAKVEKESKTP